MFACVAPLILLLLAHPRPSIAQTSTQCTSTLDLMVIVDGSNSIFLTRYVSMLRSVVELLDTLPVVPGQMRMGVTVLGTHDTLVELIPLSDNVDQLRNSILRYLDWPNGSTNTHLALAMATSELLRNSRPEVPKVIAVMTDGRSNNRFKTLQMAAEAKDQKITILSVASGYMDVLEELESMASNRTVDVFSFSNFQKLIQRILDLARVDCVSDCQQGVDMIFVLDGSNSVTLKKYLKALVAVKNVTLTFLRDYPNSRIGVVTYSTKIGKTIPLTNQIGELEKIPTLKYPNEGTATAVAIRYATNEILNEKRAGIAAVIVVITDGQSKDRKATIAAAQEAKDNGVTIYSIGVGVIDKTELNEISSGSQSMLVNSFESLSSNLPDLVNTFCLQPAATPLPPFVGVCERTVDVLFLVDSSNDVGAFNFQTVKSAVSQAARYFITNPTSRVGVLAYSNVTTYTGLQSNTTILEDISGLSCFSGSRKTGQALLQSAQIAMTSSRAGKLFSVVLLITGPSSDYVLGTVSAQLVLEHPIWVLEITDNVDENETKALTTDTFINKVKLVGVNRRFHATTYDEVASQLLRLSKAICSNA